MSKYNKKLYKIEYNETSSDSSESELDTDTEVEPESNSDETDDTDSDFEMEVFKLDDIKKDMQHEIEKQAKDKIIKDLIKDGIVKTCKMCGTYQKKYAYRTRLCYGCHRVYSHKIYIKRKEAKIKKAIDEVNLQDNKDK